MLNPWKSGGPADDAGTPDETGTPETAREADDTASLAGEAEDAASAPEGAPATGDAMAMEAELADLKDRHLRLAAEFENFRKRTRKEAGEGRERAQADLVQQILPTLDDLARVADTPHESTTVQALDEGIELILRNLRKQLSDAGLTRIEALEDRFDPQRHQAVLSSETDDPALDETISRVFVDGYEFLGRLVRPAQVEVRNYEAPAAGNGDA